MAEQTQFLELYFAHEEGLRVFVRTLLHDRSEFDDIFQSVVLTLWKKFDTYDPTRQFGAWARGVAVREVFEARRQLGRRPTPFSPQAVQVILDSFDRMEKPGVLASQRMEALEMCVEGIPGRWRQLIDLRYSDGLAIAEMAARVGRTLAGTQRDLSRARKYLAECIKRRISGTAGRP